MVDTSHFTGTIGTVKINWIDRAAHRGAAFTSVAGKHWTAVRRGRETLAERTSGAQHTPPPRFTMTGFRLPTTFLLAGTLVGMLSCDLAFAQRGAGYRWVTGQVAEVQQPSEEEPVALPIPAKIFRYAQTLLGQYDADGNGTLESREWPHDRLAVDPRQADANRDDALSAEELARYIADYGRYRKIRMPRRPFEVVFEDSQPLEADVEPAAIPADEPSGDADTPPEEPTTEDGPGAESDPESASDAEEGLIDKPADGVETDGSTAAEPAAGRLLKPPPPEPEAIDPRLLPSHTRYYVPRRRLAGMPEWFQTRDANGDGQISLAEYSARPTQATIARFRRYDRNKDGVITTSEYARASGGR